MVNTKNNNYYKEFFNNLISNSKSSIYDDAVKEWDIIDCEDDASYSGVCICTKEELRYIYKIQNRYNNNVLTVGSSCIKKFGRNDLTDKVNIQDQCFKLCQKINDRKFITIEDFSRKLLKYLWDNQYIDTDNNYRFLLKMFNKHDKSKITKKQSQKIKGLIYYQIMKKIKENDNKII